MKYQDSLELSWKIPTNMKDAESWPRTPSEIEEESSTDDEDAHHVTVCDINKNMLEVGQRRAALRGLIDGKFRISDSG